MSITHDTPRPTANARPLDVALSTWRDAKPSGTHGWYSARCTGHHDKQASLSFREAEDGGIILNCHAGCSREAIIAGAGLAEKVLHVRGKYRPTYQPRPKYDIHQLAHAKLLPWQFLFQQGVIDDYRWHNSDVVQITYYDADGSTYPKVRVRTGPSGNKDSFWDEDTPGLLIPYGYQWLDLAREKGYLLLGEGESDGWTCRYHDIPYLGVPGAKQTKCLDGSLLNEIPAIYVIQEPDAAGQGFYKDVHRRLRETGYRGQMFAMPWQKLTGWKDPSELHRMIRLKDPNDTHTGFQQVIDQALTNAIPAGDDIDLSVSVMTTEEWVPRAEYEELRQKYHEQRAQLDFILQVIAVPSSTLKPTDKIVNIVIDDEIRNHAATEAGFYPTSMRQIAKRTAIGYNTAIASKKRLVQAVGLYEQETVSYYHTKADGSTTKTESILLRPQPVQRYPRIYSTTDPIVHGGPRERKQVCERCGSEEQEIYETRCCRSCGHMTSVRKDKEPDIDDEEQIIDALSMQEEQAEPVQPEECATVFQVGTPSIDSLLFQVGTPPHEEPEISTSVAKDYTNRMCERCGRTGEIERNPVDGRLSCICYRESFDVAAAGKRARLAPTQLGIFSSV